MRRTEYYEKTAVFYIADLSKRCIHIVDALLHWDHNAVALFTFREFEKEAAERGLCMYEEDACAIDPKADFGVCELLRLHDGR